MNVRFPNKKKVRNDRELIHEMGKKMAATAEKVCLMLSVAILSDVFDFEDDEVKEFMDSYSALAESLGIGTDDIDTIQKNIEEKFDVKLS